MARILVIDDDLDLLQMVRLMLQRGGHEAVLTADGADGIAKAKELHPDLAIVDVMMPGINGYQVARRLRDDPATADITILILTARAQPVDREAAMAARADEYIAKPISPPELLQAINRLLDKRKVPLSANLILSVLSLRGGVGTTTIAVNLALTLQQANRQVCLVDLCEKSGHAAMQMRLQGKISWAEVMPQISSIGLEAIEQVMLRHKSGLQLLPAPFLPPPQPPSGDAVRRLLELLKSTLGTTVVDLGAWDAAGCAAISLSDLIIVVLTPDVASLQTTAATLRAIKTLNVSDEKVVLVLNHVTPHPGLSTAAIEKALGRALHASLPYDEAQHNALGQGEPLALSQPESPLASGVQQLVQVLAPARKTW